MEKQIEEMGPLEYANYLDNLDTDVLFGGVDSTAPIKVSDTLGIATCRKLVAVAKKRRTEAKLPSNIKVPYLNGEDKFTVLPDPDPVKHPSHYKLFPDLEVIQAIEKMLTPKEYRGYLKGNILKYRLRAGKKGAPEITIQDIQKSLEYDNFLSEAEAKRTVGEQTDD